MMPCATLGNGPAEKSGGAWHGKERTHAHAARGLAKNGNVIGITAKSGDILAHPLEGGDLIEQTKVGFAVIQKKEAIYPQAVIDGDTDDAITSKITAVIRGNCTRSIGKSAP